MLSRPQAIQFRKRRPNNNIMVYTIALAAYGFAVANSNDYRPARLQADPTFKITSRKSDAAQRHCSSKIGEFARLQWTRPMAILMGPAPFRASKHCNIASWTIPGAQCPLNVYWAGLWQSIHKKRQQRFLSLGRPRSASIYSTASMPGAVNRLATS